ncbi:hypothetical protein BGZ94_005157 [Podila epigama]|nr:hypothetical protein BGZ94_005157 [Podila epigama]
MCSQKNQSTRHQHHTPSPSVSQPASAHNSPTGSVLLPPVEIEVSPTRSYRSSSSSSRHHNNNNSDHHHQRHHRSSDSSSSSSDEHEASTTHTAVSRDTKVQTTRRPNLASSASASSVTTTTTTTTTKTTVRQIVVGNASTRIASNSSVSSKKFINEGSSSVVSFSRKGDIEEYAEEHQHQGGLLRKSASKQSITLAERGCFGRLRRSPNFILFTVFLALFVDMATYGIIVPIIPFIVSDRINGGATDTGLLLAVYAIGILCSSPLFGILGDRFVSRRTPMVIGLIGMLLSTVLFMVASHFYVFLLARFLQGVAGGSVWTLGLALITDVFPPEVLGVQMGKALIGYTLGLMMGPPLGGILYEHGGYLAPFIFCCAITFIDLGCRVLIIEEREEIVKALRQQGKQDEAIEEEAEVVAARKKERLEERTSFWKLLKNKRLIGCVIVTACNAFVFSGAEPTVPLHLATTFDLTSARIGLVFMAFSLPTLTAPLSGALSDKFGAKLVCSISLVLCGAGVMAAGIFQNSLTMIIILFTFIGITGTAILTPILAELSAVVRSTGSGDGFARAYAMFNMAFSVGVLVGPVICGIVYEHFGFRAITFVMGGTLLFATPIVLLWIGGAEQRRKDLAKFKEDEAFLRSQLPRSRYSLDFSSSITSTTLHTTDGSSLERGLVGMEGEKPISRGYKDGSTNAQPLSRPTSREDILKSARMD